ncbi:chondroitin sulfate proteoglycan 5-like [Aplochiton taeniatus]
MGREFQRVGAATLNARSPEVHNLEWGMESSPMSADQRFWNVAGNATEGKLTANETFLLSEEEKPAKVNQVIVTTATGVSSSASPADEVTPSVGQLTRTGEQEQGSGMLAEGAVESVAAPPQLSPDSAETELLLPSNPLGRGEVEEEKEEKEEPEEEELDTDLKWLNAKDTAVFDLDRFVSMTSAPPSSTASPSHSDVLHVDFFDPASRGRSLDLTPSSQSSLAHELQAGDPTSWAMPDNYDYLTPYEDSVSPTADEYSYSTTTETYDPDDDLKLSAGSPARSKPRLPGSGSFTLDVAPPPGRGAAMPDGADGMGGCRVGYQRQNGSCRSPCDTLPSYCFNGGQCYLLENMGIFCRCNVQDYIWHKGARCEAVVTEFQVLCLAVGASALVLLLLFMIVVCFAKKLHTLKTENHSLRKRSSKYRPTSEQHNDNFSLSTIAEGSHPNVRKLCDTPPNVPHARALAYYDNIICQDDPNAQSKLEESVKAPPPKEEESLNIHNSLTPKHENHTVLGEENSSEVNSLQNNMM